MTGRARFVCFVVLVLLCAPHRLAAQGLATLVGQPVVSVTFDVEGKPETSATVAALSDVKVGAPLATQDVRATIAHLDALGRYESIDVFGAAVPGGVSITFRLVPRHPVTRFEVRGDTGVSASLLQTFLRQRYGGVPTGVRLSAIEQATVQYLSDEGYLDADVTAQTELLHEPEGANLVIDVRAGTLATIGNTEVRGSSPIPTADIVRRVGGATGQPFKRRVVESALVSLEDDLRARGYYEAQATLQTARTVTGVDLTVTISAGPRVDVRVVPANALPGSVDALIPVRRLGSADEDLLEDSRARIEQALRAQGHWRASAPFTRVLDASGGQLVITFNIDAGPRYYVDRIDLPASLTLPAGTLRDLLGIKPGDLFDAALFEQGLAAVVDAYRRSGHYRVEAKPTYEEVPSDPGAARALVVLHPNISEGPRGVLTNVTFAAGDPRQVPEADLRAVMQSRVGQPYVEFEAARDRQALESLYRNRGFRTAQVIVRPVFTEDGRQVSLDVQVNEGRQVRIGQISIVGNEDVAERAIRDELGLEIGEPAGEASLAAAHSRLVNMGVFRRVTITAADQFSEPETHLVVNVVESPATTSGFGAGLEGGRFNDRLELAPRGSFDISRRNVGGRNRILSFFARGSLRRNPDPIDPDENEPRGLGFAEYRVTGTFRERRAFRTDTDLLFGVASEQAVRTTFNFIRRSITAEILHSFSPQVSLSGRYALDFTRLFDERFGEDDQPLIDRAFPQVRLSIFSTGVGWDRRDSLLSPTRGTFVTADFQVAGRNIGSEVGFVKTFLQGSAYRTLKPNGRTVVAGRAEVGLARGFSRTVTVVDAFGVPSEQVVEDIPASQRFFAGGSTTVRGFQLDRLGVPELLTETGLPLGGNGLVVLNAEIRRRVAELFGRPLSAVAFTDAGNVFQRASQIDFKRLRGTAGFGVRYDSPLGPLRLDFGFKMHPQTNNGRRERGWEYHLSIGEAF